MNGDAIANFAKEYKGSEEEKRDLLSAYTKSSGNMDDIYESVMLSNVLEDDTRFRKIIEDALHAGEIKPFLGYENESKKSKTDRIKVAKKEAREAEQYAKELGVHGKLFGKQKSKEDSEADLAALIKGRMKHRTEAMIEAMEQKYGGKAKSKAAKKRKVHEDDQVDDPEEESSTIPGTVEAKGKKAKKQRSDNRRA